MPVSALCLQVSEHAVYGVTRRPEDTRPAARPLSDFPNAAASRLPRAVLVTLGQRELPSVCRAPLRAKIPHADGQVWSPGAVLHHGPVRDLRPDWRGHLPGCPADPAGASPRLLATRSVPVSHGHDHGWSSREGRAQTSLVRVA